MSVSHSDVMTLTRLKYHFVVCSSAVCVFGFFGVLMVRRRPWRGMNESPFQSGLCTHPRIQHHATMQQAKHFCGVWGEVVLPSSRVVRATSKKKQMAMTTTMPFLEAAVAAMVAVVKRWRMVFVEQQDDEDQDFLGS